MASPCWARRHPSEQKPVRQAPPSCALVAIDFEPGDSQDFRVWDVTSCESEGWNDRFSVGKRGLTAASQDREESWGSKVRSALHSSSPVSMQHCLVI